MRILKFLLIAISVTCCIPSAANATGVSRRAVKKNGSQNIFKCCPLGQQIYHENEKSSCVLQLNNTKNLSELSIYKNTIKEKGGISDTVKIKDFTLVYNAKFIKMTSSKFQMDMGIRHYILENGQLGFTTRSSDLWMTKENASHYCVDYTLYNSTLKLAYLILEDEKPSYTMVDRVISIGQLLSSVFLFITLLIYWLLPELRNINGIIQMAHMTNMMVMFLLKYAIYVVNSLKFCKTAVPMFYFCAISNFLWLALMSFNIWWTFRGSIQHNKIHRRGELVKFIVYCACVFGTAGVLTIFATIMDNIDLKNYPYLVGPSFSLCLSNGKANNYYMYIPIGILTIVNCTLFSMTLYNIWKIKRGIEKFSNSETKRNNATVTNFKVYAKLSLLMGVTWILEVIQSFVELSPTLFLIVNFYNACIGVIIFIIFVSDKKHIIMLLKRFNIKSKLTTENTSIKVSGATGSSMSKNRKQDTCELALESTNYTGEMERSQSSHDFK